MLATCAFVNVDTCADGFATTVTPKDDVLPSDGAFAGAIGSARTETFEIPTAQLRNRAAHDALIRTDSLHKKATGTIAAAAVRLISGSYVLLKPTTMYGDIAS
jgi:hypothetical protein